MFKTPRKNLESSEPSTFFRGKSSFFLLSLPKGARGASATLVVPTFGGEKT